MTLRGGAIPFMPTFLRGRLVGYRQESLDPRDDPTVHGFLQVAVEQGPQVTILDESCLLTASLDLRVGTMSTYVVSPYWATRPQYHSVEALPPTVGRFERQVWWEEPIWWGGLVRDLQWHGPLDEQAVVSALEATQEWWLLETPAGEILYDPLLRRSSGEVGPRRAGRPGHLEARLLVPIARHPCLRLPAHLSALRIAFGNQLQYFSDTWERIAHEFKDYTY